MGFPKLVRRHLYIDSGPTSLSCTWHCYVICNIIMFHPKFCFTLYYGECGHPHAEYNKNVTKKETKNIKKFKIYNRVHAHDRVNVRTKYEYRKTSNLRRTLVSNKIIDHSDVVGASPVGAAPNTSSFSTQHLASRDSAKTAVKTVRESFKCWDLVCLILETWW